MAWKTNQFSVPVEISVAHGSADEVIQNANIGEVTQSHSYSMSDSASASAIATNIRNEITSLLSHELEVLCAHPFMLGVGQGEKNPLHLSAPNAVNTVAEKLIDAADDTRPEGTLDALCLLVHTAETQQLSDQLALICDALPLPELLRIKRHAKNHAALDTSKLIQKPTPLPGIFRKHKNVVNTVLAQSCTDAIAIAEAFNYENITPIEELNSVAAQKQELIAQQQSSLSNIQDLFSGGVGSSFFTSGTSQSIASALKSSSPPGHEFGMAVAILITGQSGSIELIREVVGV